MSARLPDYDGLIFGSKIRLIQTARNQLNMDDADYRALLPVSYTHLDVYKRQGLSPSTPCPLLRRRCTTTSNSPPPA